MCAVALNVFGDNTLILAGKGHKTEINNTVAFPKFHFVIRVRYLQSRSDVSCLVQDSCSASQKD